MKQIAIDRATQHLDLAKKAAERLKIEDGKQAYQIAWSEFLSQSSRFYSKLEQGAKGCTKSEPWFGKKKHERKTDPLLSYIHHARNSDEHGLEYIITRAGTSLEGTFTSIADFDGVKFNATIDAKGQAHFEKPESIPEGLTVRQVEPHMTLLRVKDDRYDDWFDPPQSHLGEDLDPITPERVAHSSISYFEKMLEEASGLPRHL